MFISEFNIYKNDESINYVISPQSKHLLIECINLLGNLIIYIIDYYWKHKLIFNTFIILFLCFKIKSLMTKMFQEIEQIKIDVGYSLPISNHIELEESNEPDENSEKSDDESKDTDESDEESDKSDKTDNKLYKKTEEAKEEIFSNCKIMPKNGLKRKFFKNKYLKINKKNKCHHTSSLIMDGYLR